MGALAEQLSHESSPARVLVAAKPSSRRILRSRILLAPSRFERCPLMIQFRGGAPVQRRRGYPSVEKFCFSKLSELHVGDAYMKACSRQVSFTSLLAR